jgi:hypothetical protein
MLRTTLKPRMLAMWSVRSFSCSWLSSSTRPNRLRSYGRIERVASTTLVAIMDTSLVLRFLL